MKIFVSHSNADKTAAAAFVELARSALSLSARDIRCTSVDGYKLDAGSRADDQLRQEVFDADTFVALLSPTSITSTYVMFELGARWGANRSLAPVMIAGLDPSSLKAPLSAIHAIAGSSESDMHQLIEQLARDLKMQPESPSAYGAALRNFLSAVKKP